MHFSCMNVYWFMYFLWKFIFIGESSVLIDWAVNNIWLTCVSRTTRRFMFSIQITGNIQNESGYSKIMKSLNTLRMIYSDMRVRKDVPHIDGLLWGRPDREPVSTRIPLVLLLGMRLSQVNYSHFIVDVVNSGFSFSKAFFVQNSSNEVLVVDFLFRLKWNVFLIRQTRNWVFCNWKPVLKFRVIVDNT